MILKIKAEEEEWGGGKERHGKGKRSWRGNVFAVALGGARITSALSRGHAKRRQACVWPEHKRETSTNRVVAGGGPYFDRHERRECVAAVGHLLQKHRYGNPRLSTALACDLGDKTFWLVFLQKMNKYYYSFLSSHSTFSTNTNYSFQTRFVPSFFVLIFS